MWKSVRSRCAFKANSPPGHKFWAVRRRLQELQLIITTEETFNHSIQLFSELKYDFLSNHFFNHTTILSSNLFSTFCCSQQIIVFQKSSYQDGVTHFQLHCASQATDSNIQGVV